MTSDLQQAISAGLAGFAWPIVWLGDSEWTTPGKTAAPEPPAGFVELELEFVNIDPTFGSGRLEKWLLLVDVFVQSGTSMQVLGARVAEVLTALAAIAPAEGLRLVMTLAEEGDLVARGEGEPWLGRRVRVPLFQSVSVA